LERPLLRDSCQGGHFFGAVRGLGLVQRGVLASKQRLHSAGLSAAVGGFCVRPSYQGGHRFFESGANAGVSVMPTGNGVQIFGLGLIPSAAFASWFNLLTCQQQPLSLVLYGLKNKVRGIFLASRTALTELAPVTPGNAQMTLTELSATSVASMFGYSRRYQRAHFVRLSFVKYLRRYLLVLAQLRVNLGVVGVIRQFRGYFRSLNLPTEQAFLHPLTGKWLTDVSVVLPARRGLRTSRAELTSSIQSLVKDNLLFLDEPSHAASAVLSGRDAVVMELVGFF
jgi:hypothetical protein